MFQFQVAFIVFIVLGAIFHEFMHAFIADRLGDPTARHAGRLTLNPLAHVDLFGTIILPLLLILVAGVAFGYAKPVPYNPYNLKNQKRDPALVGASGPLSNLLIAFVLGMIVRFMPFNNFSIMLSIGVYANVLLAVFNLVPIPPLDGSKVLFAILPDSAYHMRETLERWGIFILLIFILFFFRLIIPFINLIYWLIVGRSFF